MTDLRNDNEPIRFTLGAGNQSAICGVVAPAAVSDSAGNADAGRSGDVAPSDPSDAP